MRTFKETNVAISKGYFNWQPHIASEKCREKLSKSLRLAIIKNSLNKGYYNS